APSGATRRLRISQPPGRARRRDDERPRRPRRAQTARRAHGGPQARGKPAYRCPGLPRRHVHPRLAEAVAVAPPRMGPAIRGPALPRGLRPGAPVWSETARHQPRKNRSEEHTSELQSRENLVCRLLLEKKKIN